MLTPEYLERCPDRIVDLWSQAETDILVDMARKINAYDYFSSATDWQAKKLKEMGLMNEEILRRLSALTGRTVEELKRLMNEAGMTALATDDAAYRKAGFTPGPLKDNPALIAVMDVSLKKTSNTMTNLTRTTARVGSQQFVEALDRVYMQVVVGGMSQDAAVRQAIKQLAREGLRAVKYANRTDHVDVAVRRAVRTGVNQTAGILQETRADEFGCDLVETSAHSGARPDHAEWQGKVFSRSGKSDKYPPFEESTGYGTVTGLCGANCRHSFYPFFEDSEPLYTEKELEAMNAKKYKWQGKDLTEYEATQTQRYHERQIRSWKREQAMLRATGQSPAQATEKVAYWTARQDAFLKATGLKRRYDAEKVFDLRGNRGKMNSASGTALFPIVDLPKDGQRVRPNTILAEMNKTETGKELLSYLEQNNVSVKLKYGIAPANVRGYHEGNDTIQLYIANIRDDKEAVSTVLHEVTHIKYDIGGCLWAEVVCFAQEYKFLHGVTEMSFAEKRKLIRKVKEAYPHLNWKKGGYRNGKPF